MFICLFSCCSSCLCCIQELADCSVYGGGGGHKTVIHAGGSLASVSWGSLLWWHNKDQCSAGHDEDGPLYHCIDSSLLVPTNFNISSLNPQLVSCNVSSYQHTSVSLEFFETVVRYDKFFIVEPQHIPTVLVSLSLCVCVCVSTCITHLTVFTDRWHFWTNGDCETTAQRSAAGWLTSFPDLSKVCSEYNVHCQPTGGTHNKCNCCCLCHLNWGI